MNKETMKNRNLRDIKVLCLDFDGVLTTNQVIVDENGKESIICNRGDSYGISKLKENGISTIVISKETNGVVRKRCKKLNIKCYSGIDNKLECLKSLDIPLENIAYIGNDVNDLGCLLSVKYPVIVADSHKSLFLYGFLILERNGGCGAIREFIDMILEAKIYEIQINHR